MRGVHGRKMAGRQWRQLTPPPASLTYLAGTQDTPPLAQREGLSNAAQSSSGERHLRHVLTCYMVYYDAARTHLSLRKDAPIGRVVQSVGCIKCRPFSAACITNPYGFDLRQGHQLQTLPMTSIPRT